MVTVVKHTLTDMSQTQVCELYSNVRARSQQAQDIVHDLYDGKSRLILIYGEIFAGKAHFAKQVVDNLKLQTQQYRGRSVNAATIGCVGITSWIELMLSLARAVGANIRHKETAEFKVMSRLRELNSNSTDVLIFTNFEDIVSQETLIRRFVPFIQEVLDTNAGVSVLVTSRVNTYLSNRHGFKTCKLEPMSEPECLSLLKTVIPYCKTLEPLYLIVRRCCYRPALILRVCQILLTHHKVLTPEEVAHALRTPEGALDVFTKYPSPEGSLTDAIKKQLERLPAPLESDTRKLCYLNGSFGVTEATKKLRKSDPADFKLTTLVPLHEHAVVKIDRLGQQIQIDPFIRAFLLDKKSHVRHNDPHKKIIVDFLGEILRHLRFDISVRTKGRALGFAQDNFQTLEATLTQAVHTFGEESYKVYLQVIELEEGSMSAVCPEKASTFYKSMADAAYKFGSPREQALLQGFFAVSLIEKKGDELSSAADIVTDSLKRLTPADNYHRLVLMRRLGWMHVRLGNNRKAKVFLTGARDLCERVPRDRQDMVEPHHIQILSHLAIVNSFLGNFPEAEKILRSTIPNAKRVMPDHPVVAVLLQTMGLNSERQGQNDKALTWYHISGCERQKLEKTLPSYLVTNLNNRASRYLWRKELEKAFPLLEKALNLRRKLGWWDYNTALTLWYRANAYLFRFQFDESVRSCEQAKEVLVRCTPRHPSNVDVRLTLAHAHLVLGQRQKARLALQETLQYAGEFQENMNEISYLTSLEHLILMRELESDMENLHQRLIQEAERLSDVFRKTDNSKYFLLQRKLSSWREFLARALFRESDLRGVTRNMDRTERARVYKRGCQNVENPYSEGQGEDKARVGGSKGLSQNVVSCTGNPMEGMARLEIYTGNQQETRVTREDDSEKTWNIRFTCQHCEMLGLKHVMWRQNRTVVVREEIK